MSGPRRPGGPRRRARDTPESEQAEGLLAPRPQERLLIESAEEWRGEKILCTSVGYGQIGAALATARPSAQVTCWFLDAYHAEEARRRIAAASPEAKLAAASDNAPRGTAASDNAPRGTAASDNAARGTAASDNVPRGTGTAALPANLALVCEADPPEAEVDLVLVPLSAGGESELSREILQLGHERLRTGGMLVASSDNRDDGWLDDQMRRIFDAVTRRPSPLGVAYIARKTGPLKRRIDFGRGFAFRDRGRLIEAVSRPGVFAHGRVDMGARALLERMEVPACARVLDIGCGSGVLSFAAALRAEGVRVRAVDASARAIQVTEVGAEKNGLQKVVTAERNASGRYEPLGGYDIALANPPYFASFKIAQLFVDGARAALRPGGRLLLVTKMADWYRESMASAGWSSLEIHEVKGYAVVECVRGG